MYKITRSHQGSALLVGLIITILLTIMTVSFLDKILTLGKTSNGIDNSAQSYSLATGLIEEQLMNVNMTKETPWLIPEKAETTLTKTWRILTAYTGGDTMPMSWKWNSPFSTDWNIIGMGEPTQIVIPENVAWGSVSFLFRVPNIPWETSATWSTSSSGIILWTFGYSGATLYASWETNIFKFNEINNTARYLDNSRIWNTNTGTVLDFPTFYNDAINGVWLNGAKCIAFKCTLKLSMLRPFVSDLGKSYSFLEYKIVFPPGTTLPSQYMIINSSAYVDGFLRSRQVHIPQITTSTANDFAVLQ